VATAVEMSWFDTGGIATLAKTALKDMQKHIDKGNNNSYCKTNMDELFLNSCSSSGHQG
jgi:hypothetical protein